MDNRSPFGNPRDEKTLFGRVLFKVPEPLLDVHVRVPHPGELLPSTLKLIGLFLMLACLS